MKIFTQGKATVEVPTDESIAIYTEGTALVYREIGYPNLPAQRSLVDTITAGQVVLGSYSEGATITIEADAYEVEYAIGVNPSTKTALQAKVQGDPGELNATGALTAVMMQAGIVTSTTAAAVAATVPTGTVMDAAVDLAINESFDWAVNATGANAFTVTAATDHTLVGNMVVASGSAGLFRTRKTAVGTFVTYSLANI